VPHLQQVGAAQVEHELREQAEVVRQPKRLWLILAAQQGQSSQSPNTNHQAEGSMRAALLDE
jgi:hypothetical protein